MNMARGVVVAITFLALLVIQAPAQKGGQQRIALEAFGHNGNPTYVDVDSCTTKSTSTNLTCSLMELVVDPTTRISLQTVNFTICLCNSAIAVSYTLSDGTVSGGHSCQQCPFVVQIGQVQLYHNIEVFVLDDSGNTNITTIRISVDLPSSSASLFGGSDIPLTQQIDDCQNITSPPAECKVQTTAPPPQPMTTTTTATMTRAGKAPQSNNQAIAIAVPVTIFIVGIIVVAIMAAVLIAHRYKKFPFKYKVREKTESDKILG